LIPSRAPARTISTKYTRNFYFIPRALYRYVSGLAVLRTGCFTSRILKMRGKKIRVEMLPVGPGGEHGERGLQPTVRPSHLSSVVGTTCRLSKYFNAHGDRPESCILSRILAAFPLCINTRDRFPMSCKDQGGTIGLRPQDGRDVIRTVSILYASLPPSVLSANNFLITLDEGVGTSQTFLERRRGTGRLRREV
jgi:hypothetical protein